MKRMVDEPLIEKLKTLSKEINYNKENNTLEIGGNLEVDGKSNLRGLKAFTTVLDPQDSNPISLYCETNMDGDIYWGFCLSDIYVGFFINEGSDAYDLFYMTDDVFIYHDKILLTDDTHYELLSRNEYNLGGFIENVNTHSVYVSGQGGDVSFNFTSLKNTPIDSVQDLYLYLKNDKFACNGYYKDSSGNKEFIYYLSFGTDITKATINHTTDKLTDVLGTNLLIEDDVKEIR